MNEASDQPEILEAQWDRQQVFALFDDLAQGAQVQHVQVRSAGTGRPQDCETTLAEARELFDLRTARAIQIRYAFDNEDWCDTIMILPDAIRVIRTRQPKIL